MILTVIRAKARLEELMQSFRERQESYTDFYNGVLDLLVEPIDSIGWRAIKNFCAFLQKLKFVTVLMFDSSYPTLSMIAPATYLTRKHIHAAITTDTDIRSMRTTRFSQVVKRKLQAYSTNAYEKNHTETMSRSQH